MKRQTAPELRSPEIDSPDTASPAGVDRGQSAGGTNASQSAPIANQPNGKASNAAAEQTVSAIEAPAAARANAVAPTHGVVTPTAATSPADETAAPTHGVVVAPTDAALPAEEVDDDANTFLAPRSLPRPGRLDAAPMARGSFAEAQARAGRERGAAGPHEDSGPRRAARGAHNADALVQSAFADLVTTGHAPGDMPEDAFDENTFRFRPRVPRWLWPAASAAAVVAAVVLVVGSADDAVPTDAPARSSAMVATANNEAPTGQARNQRPKNVEAPPLLAEAIAPSGETPAADPSTVTDEAEPEPADALGDDEGIELAQADAAVDSATPRPAATHRVAKRASKRGNSKRQRSSSKSPKRERKTTKKGNKSDKKSSAAKKQARSGKQSGDAAGLLVSAKKALAAGKARKAYALAQRSRGIKRSNDALLVMGRAACRMKDEKKAKAAAQGLPFREAREVRKACRSKGIRLGL